VSTSTSISKKPPRYPAPPQSWWAGLPWWLKTVPFVSLHLACLAVLFTAVNPLVLLLGGAAYFVRMFGITAGYHRYFSHRAFKTSRAFQFVLAWLGCSALQKGPLWWASHHRLHHRHTDTAQDPHSPRTRSVWWAHVGWVLSPDYEETGWEVIRDWSVYPELRWLDRHYWVPGVALAVACWLAGGWAGLVWGFFLSTVLLYHATFLVNSVCHLFGRRRFATADQSRNNLFVALVTLGEGWHNNHHHYQSAARQGLSWWEIDVSYYLIRLLGWAGLVWGIRQPARTGKSVEELAPPADHLLIDGLPAPRGARTSPSA
jgi:stearoyl-CoA desaturase (Delta-9 desaturase)